MKNGLIFLFIFIGIISLQAQESVKLGWVHGFGTGGYNSGYSTTLDALGNVYVTGHYRGTVDFEPGPGVTNLTSTSAVDHEIFIQKLDPQGNLLWVKSVGGISYDIGNSLVVDASFNVYVTGLFSGTGDFDPGIGVSNLTSMGSDDVFVLKLDVNGDFVWAKSMGGTGEDTGVKIVVDAFSNVYTTGSFNNIVDFDPGAGVSNLTSMGGRDIFVLKLDVNGNFVWAKSIGGVDQDLAAEIVVDGSSNIYITGSFRNTVDFDPGAGVSNLTSMGGRDIFVLKLDAQGDWVWSKGMGGTQSDFGNSIALDGFSNVYVTGGFRGTVDFDPGIGVTNLTASGEIDAFIQKMDNNGNWIWTKIFGENIPSSTTSEVYGNSIDVDANGGIYIAGRFDGVIDFDPNVGTHTLSAAEPWSFFLQKLDNNGNLIWARVMERSGGNWGSSANSIISDASSNVYVTGHFSGTVDFDLGVGVQNLTTASNLTYVDDKIFIIKLEPCTITTTTLNQVACDTFITPDGQIHTSSGQYIENLTNVEGCDSFLIINFTVNYSSSNWIYETACDSYTAPDGQVYSSSGTYVSVLQTMAGCDSTITINLTIENSSAINTSITQNGSMLTVSGVGAGNTYQWIDCTNGSLAINGATNSSFNPMVNGEYAVEITNGTCTVQSSCINVLNVSVLKVEKDLRVKAYPNPTNNNFIIEFDQFQENITVRLFSVTGQIVRESQFGNTQRIELEIDQPSGVYLVELIDKNGRRSVIQLIKK